MARHVWRCPSCQAVLGHLSAVTDRRGRRRQRLTLLRHVETRRRPIRLHALCPCGQYVPIPPDTDVVQRA